VKSGTVHANTFSVAHAPNLTPRHPLTVGHYDEGLGGHREGATKTPPLFLIGAGFNADAAHEAGPVYSPYDGRDPIDCGYPLLADAARLCFGLAEVPRGKSIEDLFQKALGRGDYSPLEKLAEQLMKADHWLAWQLVSSQERNCYHEFFERFAGTHVLTFNGSHRVYNRGWPGCENRYPG